MQVFIENEANSDQKNIFDEKSLTYRKTVTVSRKYPYPYGFILETTSGDGDNLDCFVLTDQLLKKGQIVEVEPIGIVEQFEDGKEDHNILAKLADTDVVVDDQVKQKLTDFVSHVFDHLKGKKVEVGEFRGSQDAADLIQRATDLSR